MSQMRIFVAGATGALGVPVVRQLVADGHEVIGMSRRGARAEAIEHLDARSLVADALDGDALRAVMMLVRPDVVVHALTAIPPGGPLRVGDLKATNILRTDGTRNLLAAAIAAGVRKVVVESVVFIHGFGNQGPALLTEDTPLAPQLPRRWRAPIEALVSEEAQVLEATRSKQIEGVLLRFGGFYGPGAGTELMIRMLRRRALPVVKGATSQAIPWIHILDAARAVVAAVARGRAGEIYNIVDDEAVSPQELIQHLAQAVGAPPPRMVPGWVLRLIAPLAATLSLDTTLRASNAKARRELGWAPQFPNYREGITALASQLQEGDKP